MRTNEGKIWIPKDNRQEMIRTVHKLLSHAGREKTLTYIGTSYDMENLKEVGKEAIKKCEQCRG